MKNALLLIALAAGLLLGIVAAGSIPASAQTIEPIHVQDSLNIAPANQPGEPMVQTPDSGWMYFRENWPLWLMTVLGCAELIARVTPTKKDNSIVNFLISLVDSLVPNLKKGGGSFKLFSK